MRCKVSKVRRSSGDQLHQRPSSKDTHLAIADLLIVDRVGDENAKQFLLFDVVAFAEHDVVAKGTVDVQVDLSYLPRVLLAQVVHLLVPVLLFVLDARHVKQQHPGTAAHRIRYALEDTLTQLIEVLLLVIVPVRDHLAPFLASLHLDLANLVLMLGQLLGQLVVVNEAVPVGYLVDLVGRVFPLIDAIWMGGGSGVE